MPKPILICRVSKRADIDSWERDSIFLQDKMNDYHVVLIPCLDIPYMDEEDFKCEVYNVPDAHDHLAEELRQLIRETLCH